MPEPYDVPAVIRVAEIMQCVAASRQPTDVATLLASTGISRSTLYLLLESLLRRRWLEKRDGGYTVGAGLFELGSAYLRLNGLQPAFRAEAAGFLQAHNEGLQLAVLDGAEVLYVAREDANRPVRLVSDVGTRLPAHCSALGKALLASLDDREVAALYPDGLCRLTPRSLGSLPDLLAELAQVRAQGLARDREEVSAGLHCFAAYVGELQPPRRLAVSTSIPLERLDEGREEEIGGAIRRLARKIALRLAP